MCFLLYEWTFLRNAYTFEEKFLNFHFKFFRQKSSITLFDVFKVSILLN